MMCIFMFEALKLPPGRTTVMHLVARETLPEPNSHGEELLFVCSVNVALVLSTHSSE